MFHISYFILNNGYIKNQSVTIFCVVNFHGSIGKLNIMKNVCVLLVQLHFIVHMSHFNFMVSCFYSTILAACQW